MIVWHHFALYPLLAAWADPLIGAGLHWLAEYARATQVFFVIGGFVLAQSLDDRQWGRTEALGRFVVERYLRLGLPYLAVIALILPIYSFSRGWLPAEVLGAPVTLPQLLAHLFFLQDILGYESLSAGFWFICINFQLSLIYVVLLFLRDRFARSGLDWVAILGWPVAALSLFYANRYPALDDWFIFFFPYFFLGVVIQRVHKGSWRQAAFWLYQGMFCLAMLVEWRWRLGVAACVGLLLYWSEGGRYSVAWSRLPVIRHLGQISFSLFLVHFPVLVLVSAIWARLGLTEPLPALVGLCVAFLLSVLAASVFHRWVEIPVNRLKHKTRQFGSKKPLVQSAA